jgi:hypothetical protein
MAKEDDKKKPGEGGGDDNANKEVMLGEQQRDPEEAAFAEQAIHEYASWVLDTFRENVQTALDSFLAWTQSQTDPKQLDNAAHFDQIGQAFMQYMGKLTGGLDKPIGKEIGAQIGGMMDQAVRDEKESTYFIGELSRAARDVSWFLRDNLQGCLSGQWDQLLDLAYEGSTDFIPVLHQFGMPIADWNPQELQGKLQEVSTQYLSQLPKKQEEAEKEGGEQGEKKEGQEEAAQDSKKEFEEEEEQKAAS